MGGLRERRQILAPRFARAALTSAEVTGPVERARCNALFSDPVLTPVYRLWRKKS
jgi:hypothetical protein